MESIAAMTTHVSRTRNPQQFPEDISEISHHSYVHGWFPVLVYNLWQACFCCYQFQRKVPVAVANGIHPFSSCFKIASLSPASQHRLSKTEAKAVRPLVTAVSSGVSPCEFATVRRELSNINTSWQNSSWPLIVDMWRQVFPWGVVRSNMLGSMAATSSFINLQSPDFAASKSRPSIFTACVCYVLLLLLN